MVTAQQWLDVVTNNLANASTNGFKKDGLAFGDGLVRELAANAGAGQRIGSLGSGSTVQTQYTDFSPGVINTTGNALDLAINQEKGAFAVQTKAGLKYSRDGALQINPDRQLVTKTGNLVLNRQLQPIVVPQGKISVTEDGTVKVDDKAIDQIGVFDGSFAKEGGGVFRCTNPTLLDKPMIKSGALEASNVSTIDEMIAMIRINRSFELAQRTVQSQDDTTQRLINSLEGK